ncbi:MAG TPA: flagellar filament capping protein FliD [Myxococcales bacterium]|nr:flagellar filament capping protein FliD [Myxococcales bacterium]
MATTPVFTASGLASGLDTASLIQQLVSIESQPITALQTQQSALKSQVSALGSIASALSALQSAADNLAQSGAVSIKATSSNTSFAATAQPGAAAGQYSVSVDNLAVTAKWRSQGYLSSDSVKGGSLHIAASDTSDDIPITDGESLQDIALAINQSKADVNATVLSDGTSQYLSITANQSGYPIGGQKSDALSVTMTPDSSQSGTALAMGYQQIADNAQVTVDGLPVPSRSNQVTAAIPGVTISAESVSTQPETLVLAADGSGTAANLQAFVNAYNGVMGLVQQQLNVTASTNTAGTLAGDPTIRDLQQQLQSLFSTTVPGVSGPNSLASIGLTTDKTGVLSLDTTTLDDALQQNASSVNAIFAQANTGLGAMVDSLTSLFTDPIHGAVTIRTQGLNGQISSIDDETAQMQARVDSYQQGLQAQFAAMEALVSQLKTSANYLTALSNSSSSSGK